MEHGGTNSCIIVLERSNTSHRITPYKASDLSIRMYIYFIAKPHSETSTVPHSILWRTLTLRRLQSMASPCSFLWGRKRSRLGNADASTSETLEPTVAQAKAAVMPREGGRFVKPKAELSKAATRSVDERLRAERDAAQNRLSR
jgi:hypothetical protein